MNTSPIRQYTKGLVDGRPLGIINVKEFRARGDGEADDTEPILEAVERAKDLGNSLFFPNGVYKVRRGIELTGWNNCHIFGEKGVIIRKKAAVTQELTQDAETGDTEFYVEDASEFEIDSNIYVQVVDSATDTYYGRITDIDTSENLIYTEHLNVGFGEGLIQDAPSGTTISSTFPIIHLPEWEDTEVENILIENIEVDGNITSDEEDQVNPKMWPLSTINIENPTSAENSLITLNNVTVRNSPADGISIQGGNKSKIIECNIFNSNQNGIHLGTDHTESIISENFIEDAERNGILWCSNVKRVVAKGNIINDTNSAFSHTTEEGSSQNEGETSIIDNNIIDDSSNIGINISDWKDAIVSNNILTDVQDTGIKARKATRCNINNNTLSNFHRSSEYGIILDDASDSVCVGNIIDVPSGETAISDTGSDNCIIKDNVELE